MNPCSLPRGSLVPRALGVQVRPGLLHARGRVLHLRLVVDLEHAVLVVPQLISELGYLRGLLAKDAIGLRFNQVDSVHSF